MGNVKESKDTANHDDWEDGSRLKQERCYREMGFMDEKGGKGNEYHLEHVANVGLADQLAPEVKEPLLKFFILKYTWLQNFNHKMSSFKSK